MHWMFYLQRRTERIKLNPKLVYLLYYKPPDMLLLRQSYIHEEDRKIQTK